MSKKSNPQKPKKTVIKDGLPNNIPFDLSEKKKKEIRDRIEKVYGGTFDKKSDKN